MKSRIKLSKWAKINDYTYAGAFRIQARPHRRGGKATRILVEHKDRLTRFGFEYINLLFPGEVVIINKTLENSEAEIMEDFVSLVTSFCARLYGRRRSKRKTEILIKELNDKEK